MTVTSRRVSALRRRATGTIVGHQISCAATEIFQAGPEDVENTQDAEASLPGPSRYLLSALCRFSLRVRDEAWCTSGHGLPAGAQYGGSPFVSGVSANPVALKQQIGTTGTIRDNASGGKQHWADV
jgi:hypothetical protein